MVNKNKKLKLKLNRQKRKETKKTKLLLRKAGLKIIKQKIRHGQYKKAGIKTTKKTNINTLFQRGIRTITIKDIQKVPESDINKHYQELFKGLINDKNLMKLMIQEENIQKIKGAFETQIKVYDINNHLLAEAKKGSGDDLMNLKKLGTKINKGREIDETGHYLNDIKNAGYQISIHDKGICQRVEIKLIFRTAGI